MYVCMYLTSIHAVYISVTLINTLHSDSGWRKTFLKYLEDWEKSVEARVGFSKAEKQKMLLSAETRLGLKFTDM